MSRYIVNRSLQSIVVIVAISILVFIAINASGDPAALLAPIDASAEDVEALRVRMGLDQPLYVRYLRFLTELSSGEIRSFRHKQPPLDLIVPHFVRSLQLGVPALFFAAVLGIPIGIWAATRRGTPLDTTILSAALIGQAIPLFLLSTILIWIFAVNLGVLPVSGRGSVKHFVLPVLSLFAFNFAIVVRLTRSSYLDVLGEDFILTARSKGVLERVVMFRHIFPNAALPIISLIGIRIGAMLSGQLVVESIFSWPGIGKLLYDAILQRDIPLVVVGTLAVGILIAILNLLVDLSYLVFDPRIRY